MKPGDLEWTGKELMPLVADEQGNSLWDVVSIMPSALYADAVPILAREVTLVKALEILRGLGGDRGLTSFVLWPSWAYLPEEWNIDNEDNFAMAQYYQHVQSVAHLLPKRPDPKPAQQKAKSTKKRGKKQ